MVHAALGKLSDTLLIMDNRSTTLGAALSAGSATAATAIISAGLANDTTESRIMAVALAAVDAGAVATPAGRVSVNAFSGTSDFAEVAGSLMTSLTSAPNHAIQMRRLEMGYSSTAAAFRRASNDVSQLALALTRPSRSRHLDAAAIENPAAVARLQAAVPTAGSLCDNLAPALLNLTTDEGAAPLETRLGTTVLNAIGQRRWSDAASALTTRQWCAQEPTSCASLVSALQMGCTIEDAWAVAPKWRPLLTSARTSNASFVHYRVVNYTGPASMAPAPIINGEWVTTTVGSRRWAVATLVFTLQMATNSSLSCTSRAGGGSSPATTVNVQVAMQPCEVRLRIYAPRPTAEVIRTVVVGNVTVGNQTEAGNVSVVSFAPQAVTLPVLTPDLARSVASTLHVGRLGDLRLLMVNASVKRLVNGTEVDETSHGWFDDFEALQVDPEPLRLLQTSPQLVCADFASSGATGTNHRFEISHANCNAPQIVPVSTRGLAVASALAADVLKPTVMHRAPEVACKLTCPDEYALAPIASASAAGGTVPSAYSGAFSTLALLPYFSMNVNMSHCVAWLVSDYATCGTSKTAAEARFVMCMRLPNETLLSLPSWWSDTLTSLVAGSGSSDSGSGSSDSATGTAPAATLEDTPALEPLIQLFGCSAYADLQMAKCQCAARGTLIDDELRMDGLTPQASARVVVTPRPLSWRPTQARVVRSRLHALGYGELSNVDQQEHATRLFMCAAVGVLRFESACDHGVKPCAVAGERCVREVASRGSCLLVLPCATGLVINDAEHSVMRAADAPRWVELRSTTGVDVAPVGASAFATSWVAEALVVVGRRYAETANPSGAIRVKAASSRDGGLVASAAQRQTGLQVELAVPLDPDGAVDWNAIEAQVRAFESSGFGTTLQLNGSYTLRGQNGTNSTDINLRSGDVGSDAASNSTTVASTINATLDAATLERCRERNFECEAIASGNSPHILATLTQLPSLHSGGALPMISNATVARSAELRAMLTITGYDLGHALQDVFAVSIGTHDCAVTSLDVGIPKFDVPATLIADCELLSPGLLSGLPSVVTASVGRGDGELELSLDLGSGWAGGDSGSTDSGSGSTDSGSGTSDVGSGGSGSANAVLNASSPIPALVADVRADVLALSGTVASVIDSWGAMIASVSSGGPPTAVTRLLPELMATIDAVALQEPGTPLLLCMHLRTRLPRFLTVLCTSLSLSDALLLTVPPALPPSQMASSRDSYPRGGLSLCRTPDRWLERPIDRRTRVPMVPHEPVAGQRRTRSPPRGGLARSTPRSARARHGAGL